MAAVVVVIIMVVVGWGLVIMRTDMSVCLLCGMDFKVMGVMVVSLAKLLFFLCDFFHFLSNLSRLSGILALIFKAI